MRIARVTRTFVDYRGEGEGREGKLHLKSTDHDAEKGCAILFEQHKS